MNILKKVGRYEHIPPYYGVAWTYIHTDEVACLPVPLNWVAAIVRFFWHFLKYGHISVMRDPRQAYAQGLHQHYVNELVDRRNNP